MPLNQTSQHININLKDVRVDSERSGRTLLLLINQKPRALDEPGISDCHLLCRTQEAGTTGISGTSEGRIEQQQQLRQKWLQSRGTEEVESKR